MPEDNFDLIKEFGLENLPEDRKKALVEEVVKLIESRFNRALLNAMSEEDHQEFDKVLAKDEGVEEFIKAKVPNFAELHKKVIDDLKGEMLQLKDHLAK
jgi:uncharacterized protein YdcH (DUF465 family)